MRERCIEYNSITALPSELTPPSQDPRCIKGNRVSKLFLTIDERCEVTKFYSLYQRNQGTILKFNFSYFYEICHFKANKKLSLLSLLSLTPRRKAQKETGLHCLKKPRKKERSKRKMLTKNLFFLRLYLYFCHIQNKDRPKE